MALEFSCQINGEERVLRLASLQIRETKDGVNNLSADIISEQGEDPPDVDDDIVIRETDSGSPMTRIYGGLIRTAPTRGDGGPNVDERITSITAVDYKIYASWRIVTITLTAGTTLKACLEQLDDYLTPYGVTLDPSQAVGDTLAADMVYEDAPLSTILADLATLTGWTWEIDYEKTFRMIEPGSVPAPADLIEGDAVEQGDVEVESTRESFATRVIVKAGTNSVVEKTDTFTGDGIEDTFVLNYPLVGGRGYVTCNGIFETLDINAGSPPSAQWIYISGSNAIQRVLGGPPGVSHVITMVYDAQFPIRVQAPLVADEPTVAQTTYGLREKVIARPDIFDRDQAYAIAAAELASAILSPRIVRFATVRLGFHPGQLLHVTSERRDIDADCLITEVVRYQNPGDFALLSVVTAVTMGNPGSPEGTAVSQLPTFRKTYRDWLGSGSIAAAPEGSSASGPGGIPTSIQVNQSGQFYGDETFTYDPATGEGRVGQYYFNPADLTYTEFLKNAYVNSSGEYIPFGTTYTYEWTGENWGMEFVYDETPGTPTDFGTYQRIGFSIGRSFDGGIFKPGFVLYNGGVGGTGAVQGLGMWAQRNPEGDGAASHVRLEDRNGVEYAFWVDANGVMRVGSDAPTEDDSISDLSGAPLAGGGGGGYWTTLTNGDATTPELIFAGGDVITMFVAS